MLNEAALMHGVEWNGQDLLGWSLSEKYNGCRAAWDGARMWSRGGHEIDIPKAWRMELPALPLDGEIYAGRRNLVSATLAVTCGRFHPFIRFMVFDAMIDGDLNHRAGAVRQALAGCRYAKPVQRIACTSTLDAMDMLGDIQRRGGEGVMAQDIGRPYTAGRTARLLKLKNKPLYTEARSSRPMGYTITAV